LNIIQGIADKEYFSTAASAWLSVKAMTHASFSMNPKAHSKPDDDNQKPGKNQKSGQIMARRGAF
jgi:hypothetical protein